MAKQDTKQNVEDQNEAIEKSMAKLSRYRAGYVRGTHCGDKLAALLDGTDLLQVARVGEKVLDDTAEELLERYEHLNPGQQRMCIGNRIRATVKKNPDLLEVVAHTVGKKLEEEEVA